MPPAPLLLGRHVLAMGVSPGPRVGEVLRLVYEEQLDGIVTTLDEAIDRGQQIVAAGRSGHEPDETGATALSDD